MGRPRRDIGGQVRGTLRAVELCRSHPVSGNAVWVVECTACGRRCEMVATNFLRAKRCGKCGARKDLTGNVSGRLTVLGFSHSRDWKAYWCCRCACGRAVVLPTAALIGREAYKSCGCARTSVRRLNDVDRVRNRLLLDYRKNAELRGREWRLSDEEAWARAVGHCAYCGRAPEERAFFAGDRRSRTIRFAINGIDQRDPRRGYTPDNAASSCARCNRMKSDRSAEEFIAQVRRVADHLQLLSPSR